MLGLIFSGCVINTNYFDSKNKSTTTMKTEKPKYLHLLKFKIPTINLF